MPEQTDMDSFESQLLAIDILSDEGMNVIERQLGFDGGGLWWLDPTQPAVEVDKYGNIDTGAILDVEAQAHAWLRSPFDTNPEFRDNSYHLLNRLNELARLKGLVEEVALKRYETNEFRQPNQSENRIYHSTLSLAGFGDLDNAEQFKQINNCHPPPEDVRRSFECPSWNYPNHDSYVKQLYGHSHNKRSPLPEAFVNPRLISGHLPLQPSGLPNSGQTISKNPVFNRSFVKLSGLPSLHKSQQPPSPRHKQPSRSQARHIASRFSTNRITGPDASSSPDRLHPNRDHPSSVLNRTYSKEALDQLKENEIPLTRRSDGLVQSSLLSNFLRPPLTSSGAVSDPDSDVDVSQSVELGGYGSGILSKSLTDGELPPILRDSKMKANESYSSLRSTNVIQLAILQESQLRQHSGSRGKLHGSNNSLTCSVLEVDELNRLGSKINQSQTSLSSSDVDSVEDGHGVGILSNSLTGGDLRLRGSKSKTDASFSSMRSTDVIELARLQESHLRNRSSSGNKLTGSTNSLTGSLIDGDGLKCPGNSANRSQTILNSSDVDLTRASHDGVFLRGESPKPEDKPRHNSEEKPFLRGDNGKLPMESVLVNEQTVMPTNRRRMTPKPLQIAAQIGQRGLNDGLVSESSTPVVNLQKFISPKPLNSTVCEPSTVTISSEDQQKFFPEAYDTYSERPSESVNSVTRLDSQKAFELLEARVSQETFKLNNSSSLDDGIPRDECTGSVSDTESGSQPSCEVPTAAGCDPSGCLNAVSSDIVLKSNEASEEPDVDLVKVDAPRRRLSKQTSSKIPSLSGRPIPVGAVSRIPAPSRELPTISTRSRSGSTQSSARSSASNFATKLRTPHLLPPNRSAKTAVQQNSAKPSSLPETSSQSTNQSAAVVDSSHRPAIPGPQPRVHRSDVSPTRSASRRFGRGQAIPKGARRE
ncbi:hypothetical protein P879_07466 [Paragonimus westermani]|uniref:Uncharacterized protein n=1 Tax=Paragonimus westermani TaxID=34504 RepID=A0A8T0DHR1_9TREM|nr:hypothetical protein P879_07466 [Paragonimus westermani]